MKKISKKIMLSILTVALTFIALGTSTFAWFSMNREVTATGMQVKAQADSSLAISNALAVSTARTYNFTTDAKALIPATHDTAVAVDDEVTFASSSALKYNTNPAAVDSGTGFQAVGAPTLTFDSVAVSATSDYYVDYLLHLYEDT